VRPVREAPLLSFEMEKGMRSSEVWSMSGKRGKSGFGFKALLQFFVPCALPLPGLNRKGENGVYVAKLRSVLRNTEKGELKMKKLVRGTVLTVVESCCLPCLPDRYPRTLHS
jgi:hypothetical protein